MEFKKYQFSGKMICSYCGWKMRGRMERKELTYICAKYNYNKTCTRNTIYQKNIIKYFNDSNINIEEVGIIYVEDKKIKTYSAL